MGQWGQKDHVNNYLEIADVFVVGRRDSLDILKSFYRQFYLERPNPVRLLDLGCGDGILTRQLLTVDPSLTATLLDGSEDMIDKARQFLPDDGRFTFVCSTFEQIIEGQTSLPDCDLAVSSLAIHHLSLDQKKRLFKLIFDHLLPEGYFLNIDAVRSPSEAIEQWYLKLWMEGVYAADPSEEVKSIFEGMVEAYVQPDHYARIDTLEDQMRIMREVGFRQVECFYKRGLFTLYGGKRFSS